MHTALAAKSVTVQLMREPSKRISFTFPVRKADEGFLNIIPSALLAKDIIPGLSLATVLMIP